MFAVQIVELGPPLVVGVGHLAVDVVEELASDGGAAGRAGVGQGPAIRLSNGYIILFLKKYIVIVLI